MNNYNNYNNISPLMNILNIINTPLFTYDVDILNRSIEDQGEIKHPTDKKFIDNLKVKHFTEDQSDISCGICLDTFNKDERAYILPCKGLSHHFHIREDTENCCGILPWLKDNNTCPICREGFPEEIVNDVLEELEDIVEIEVNENNLISEFLDSIDDEIQENNLISEFLESIDTDNTDNTDVNPEEELLDALNNIINTSFNNYTNNNNIPIPTPIRFIPFINIIQQESAEDFEMQQAIQRSIEER